MDNNELKPSSSASNKQGDGDMVQKGPLTGNDAMDSALENTLILDMILKLVIGHERHNVFEPPSQPQQVQTLRLVSKQWNERATKHFAKIRKPVCFGHCGSIIDDSLVNVKLQRFLNTMQDRECVPMMQRFVFLRSIFTDANEPLLQNFMRNIAPLCATEIKFYLDTCITLDLSNPLFFSPGLNALEKLKILSFKIHYVPDVYCNARYIPRFIKDILVAADGVVETVELEFTMSYDTTSWHVRQQNRLVWTMFYHLSTTVKNLSLSSVYFQQQHVIMMDAKTIKLRKLQLDSKTGLNEQEMYNFLQKHSSSLTWFKFSSHWPKRSPFPLNIPKMDDLLHLELEGYIDLSFSILNTCRNLKTLDVLNWREPVTYFAIFSKPPTVSSVARKKTSTTTIVGTKLGEIYFSCWFLQAEFVQMAATTFPNISKMHVPFKAGIAQLLMAVFEHFQNTMTELYICDRPGTSMEWRPTFYANLDCVLSGVTEEECKRIGKIDENQWEDPEVTTNMKRELSLLNLKKLRKLVIAIYAISSRELTQQITLTNFCAHFVFLKMENLQVLQMNTSDFRISRKYHELLDRKLHLKPLDD